MPQTLDRVRDIMLRCTVLNPGPITLLVVPGRQWQAGGIEQLRRWQDQGHRLAGHGWLHRADGFGGIGHRLHALVISRRVAEHLALDAAGIVDLIGRCHDWFPAHRLASPSLYVPPAWALGGIRSEALAALPFARYELLSGVYSATSGLTMRVPMLGYEADTPMRAPAIRLWNRINRRWAQARGWIRIAIHPRDGDLRLAGDLGQDLVRYRQWCDYEALP